MSKILWKSLLLSPAIFGATLVVSSSAIAVTTPKTTVEVPQPEAKETEVPEADLVVIAPNTPINADALKVLDTAPVNVSVAKTESEPQAIAKHIDAPTQVVETLEVMPQAAISQPDLTQTAVTPVEKLIVDKQATVVAQMPTTPTQAPAATPTTPATSPANTSPNTLDEVNRYSNEGQNNTSLDQVTSVTQLTDVQPTDWAFQALQSLVERYGVIAGYPDGTFRGNRAMTRYEFAAGLNAALDRVNELIAAGTADLIRREDLATLQRLQEEFAAELATLRGRVDSLEAVTAELEANQFSTTTKLVGEVIAAVTDTFGEQVNDVNNTVLQNRVRLDLQTSFTGRDVLHTRLTAGNAIPFNIPGTVVPGIGDVGTFEGQQTFNITPNTDNDVAIDWVAYDFPLLGNSRGYLAAVGGIHSDYAATVNPYFEDYDGGRGALSTFAQQNPIFRIGGGAGGAVTLAFGEGGILKPSSLTVGFLADNANEPAPNFGLLNGDYAGLAQLNFNFGDRLALAATYVHAYHNAGDGIFDIGGSASQGIGAPVVGTTLANNPSLLLPGADVPLVTNSYGVSAALRLTDGISLSGFGTYSNATLIGRGNGDIWTYGAGLAFPDLGKQGNLLGIFAGIEPTLRSLDAPGVGNFTRDYGYHIEGFYRYQLTDNISITPGVIWLTAPGQNDANDDVVIGTLRTTFNF